jgi:carbonic anhydrase
MKQKFWVLLGMLFCLPVLSTSVGAAAPVKGISAGLAVRDLLEGNARYAHHQPIHPDSLPSDAPQHPLAVILSCSDSRVPPEVIFDQGVGKLFVVRAAGNTYDQLGLESIRYAVENLGVNLIMVIGHDQCGAVNAAVKSYPDAKAGVMLTNIYPAVRAAQGSAGDPISNTIDENAKLISQRLASEPAFKSAVQSGKLKIVPARYALATGKITLLE